MSFRPANVIRAYLEKQHTQLKWVHKHDNGKGRITTQLFFCFENWCLYLATHSSFMKRLLLIRGMIAVDAKTPATWHRLRNNLQQEKQNTRVYPTQKCEEDYTLNNFSLAIRGVSGIHNKSVVSWRLRTEKHTEKAFLPRWDQRNCRVWSSAATECHCKCVAPFSECWWPV